MRQCVVTGDGAVGKVSIPLSPSIPFYVNRNQGANLVTDMSSDLVYNKCLPRRVHSDCVRTCPPKHHGQY